MKYLTRGSEVDFVEVDDIFVDDKLPVGTYKLRWNELRGFYLQKAGSFVVENKIYGNARELADMIYNGFKSRSSSTGALLHGYKGTGKTSLVKMISNQAIDDGHSVVMIDEQFGASDFNAVINKLNGCVIIFDEFEKVYRQRGQEELLSIFDGTATSKCLFLLTANNYESINTHLLNRPGRLLYSIEFSGLTEEIIDEYLDVNLQMAPLGPGIKKIFSVFSGTTFDMLKGIVDEVNRTGKEAVELLPYLNIDVSGDQYSRYNIVVESDGKLIDNSNSLEGNPLGRKAVDIWFYDDRAPRKIRNKAIPECAEVSTSDDRGRHVDLTLSMQDFKEVNGEEIVYVRDEYKITFTPIKQFGFDYNAV